MMATNSAGAGKKRQRPTGDHDKHSTPSNEERSSATTLKAAFSASIDPPSKKAKTDSTVSAAGEGTGQRVASFEQLLDLVDSSAAPPPPGYSSDKRSFAPPAPANTETNVSKPQTGRSAAESRSLETKLRNYRHDTEAKIGGIMEMRRQDNEICEGFNFEQAKTNRQMQSDIQGLKGSVRQLQSGAGRRAKDSTTRNHDVSDAAKPVTMAMFGEVATEVEEFKDKVKGLESKAKKLKNEAVVARITALEAKNEKQEKEISELKAALRNQRRR